MRKIVAFVLVVSQALMLPAGAQTRLTPKETPKSATSRADNCAPIGRTAGGELVYSVKCENLPAPPAPSPQAEVKDAAPPEPEVQRSGLFGMSYEVKRPDR
jgi:hypothetical protein